MVFLSVCLNSFQVRVYYLERDFWEQPGLASRVLSKQTAFQRKTELAGILLLICRKYKQLKSF